MFKLDPSQDPMLCSGHAACPGCIEALSARHILATMGPDTMAVIPPSCMAIIAGPQPMSSLRIPVYQPTLESSAAAASGLRRALDAQGKRDTQVLVLAGDGGTYDIGFQCLSSAAERNEDFLYICLDNEGYMNTGAQKSSSTPHFARTGSTPAGKTSRKKNLPEIMAAHGVPYVATASASHLADLVRKVEKAKGIRGTRFITVLIPCLDGWGLPDDAGLTAARYAVECGAFPLYEIEDGTRYTLNVADKPRPVADYLALQRRYRGMNDADTATLQAEIDGAWTKLVERAAASRREIATV
ncbi:pyruvate ferredoxin oxidoreductase beta subunit [Burkholderiales bacterium]|nr:pyruvate ferredoxin oxidoreductase beta subunit [Burkholderiales bacterium]